MGRKYPDLEKLSQKVAQALERAKINYAFVGGIGAWYHGSPRVTYDIDVLAEVTKENLKELVKEFKRFGFRINYQDVLLLVTDSNRIIAEIPAYPAPVRIDLWLPKSKMSKITLKRRQVGRIKGKNSWISSPEDLILEKIRTARSRDLTDVMGIIAIKKEVLDYNYLFSQAKILGIEKELKRILKQAKEEIGKY